MLIDTSFDFRVDARGKDPDSHSPTLRKYHKHLWSRPLPSGVPFELCDTTPGIYLHHRSGLGEFQLSSDAVIATFTRYEATAWIIEQIPQADSDEFYRLGYTMGGMMVFPGNRVDGKRTINQERGCNRKISDRMDLTLECVRRYYRHEDSPLAATFGRYAGFFALFEDFQGYVDFFLLQDLVSSDYKAVRFFMPFNDFNPPAIPKDLDTYLEFRRLSIKFTEARNRRIDQLALDVD
jgi:hypothetical protein